MFLGLPDDIHEEKPSFFDFENNWLPTDGPTDGRTDGPTDRRTDGQTDRPSYRDARTHLKMDVTAVAVKTMTHCNILIFF